MDEPKDKDIEFYKAFYEDNRIALLQYENLRKNFQQMVDDVLGEGYYNMEMDVYDCDAVCCEDITKKANQSIIDRLMNKWEKM